MSFLTNSFRFGAAVPADITFAVQDMATGTTSPATIGYSATPLSGLTSKAMLFMGSYHSIADGSAEKARAAVGFGATDGTNQRAVTFVSEDNVAATDARAGVSNTTTLRLQYIGGVTNFSVASAAITSGGVDVSWSGLLDVDRRHSFLAFAGANVTALAGNFDLGNSTSAVTVTPGFQADLVIFFSTVHTGFGDSGNLAMRQSFGFATRTGPTNRGVLMTEADANAAGGAPLQAILTDSCGGYIATDGSLFYKYNASNFTSTTFDVTPSAAAGNRDVGYLALKFTGGDVKIIDITTPTSTGNQAITGVGFKPRAVLAFLTNLTATDPTFSISTSDDMGGLSVCSFADEEWSHAIRINSGSDPTDTASFTGNYAMIQPSATDIDAGLATLVSFDDDGFTVNWSAVQGSARKGIAVCIK